MNWIQALGPSILMVIGGIVSWFLKTRVEELKSIEKKLQDKRREIYIQILEPYILVFTGPKGKGLDKAVETIKTFNYKRIAFELNLFGFDEVVKAYNDLFQYLIKLDSTNQKNHKETMRVFGNFLLEIRKSLGNKSTKLNEYDMLRGMLNDIDQYLS